MGSDTIDRANDYAISGFQSTLPTWGATARYCISINRTTIFCDQQKYLYILTGFYILNSIFSLREPTGNLQTAYSSRRNLNKKIHENIFLICQILQNTYFLYEIFIVTAHKNPADDNCQRDTNVKTFSKGLAKRYLRKVIPLQRLEGIRHPIETQYSLTEVVSNICRLR